MFLWPSSARLDIDEVVTNWAKPSPLCTGRVITDPMNGVLPESDTSTAVSERTLTGALADGSRPEVNGCDFLTVGDGQITKKNAFRKQRPPI